MIVETLEFRKIFNEKQFLKKEKKLPKPTPERKRRGGGGGGKELPKPSKPGCCNCGFSVEMLLDGGSPSSPMTICTFCTEDQCEIYKEEKKKERDKKMFPFRSL